MQKNCFPQWLFLLSYFYIKVATIFMMQSSGSSLEQTIPRKNKRDFYVEKIL